MYDTHRKTQVFTFLLHITINILQKEIKIPFLMYSYYAFNFFFNIIFSFRNR